MKPKKSFLELGTRMIELPAKVIEPAKKTVNVSKEDLKRAKPKIYAESIQDGVMLERARIGKLIEMKKRPEYSNIPLIVAVLNRGIEDGTSLDGIQPLIMDALLKTRSDPAKAQASFEESPPNIKGGDGEYATSIYPGSAAPKRAEIDIPGAPPRGKAKEDLIHEV